MKIIILLIPLFSPCLSHLIIHNDSNSTTSDLCIELNRRRLDLAECCKYPQIDYRNFFQGNCASECLGSRDMCCSIGCIWRTTNIIDDNNQIDHEAVKETLKKTVAHDEHWTEIIDEVVEECLGEVEAPEKPIGPCKFPWHIIKVLGCTTRKMFLQCPKMRAGAECKITKQYVEECM